MSESSCKIVPLLVAVLLSSCAAHALAQDEAPEWVPGQPYPLAGLKEFACHDYTLECGSMTSPPIERVSYSGPREGDQVRGEQIALNVRWGNCLSCHSLPNGHEGGTIAPSLAEYGRRGLPFDYTFQRIWDGRMFNPDAHMPVYGPNDVLSIQDILDLIAFIESDTAN